MFKLEGKRKFLVTLFAIALSVVFLLTGYITGTNFAVILAAVVPAFCAANFGEHMMKKK